MKWHQAILLASVTIAFMACEKKSSRFPPEPHITYNLMEPDSIHNMSSEDTLYVGFHFTDGDADLGNSTSSGKHDIFMIDNRFPTDTTQYYFPSIPGNIKDPEKGMEGDCIFFVPAAILTGLRDTTVHKLRDTTQFSIFIRDIAGHSSNVITTDTLFIVK